MRLPESLRVPARTDLALAGVATAAGLLEGLLSTSAAPTGAVVALTLVVTVSLAFRRHAPLTVLVLMVAVILALTAIEWDGGLSVFVPTLIAAATVGAELDAPRTWLGPILTVGVFVTASFVGLGGDNAEDLGYVSILYGGAWALGRTLHARGRRVEELVDRVDSLNRERAVREAAVLAAERARIARELHDIVSHSISVIALQSQVVRRRLGPEQQSAAADLEGIETVARQAMGEMRRLLGVLRPTGDRASLEPQPGLDQLSRLIEHAGLPVRLEVEGRPVLLPPGVDLAAYRLVQESLTNVRKHAEATSANVVLRYAERHLDIEIVDDGRRRDRPGSSDGAGHGIVGMRERVLLYGGTFDAAPMPAGGFSVRARLPFREAAP